MNVYGIMRIFCVVILLAGASVQCSKIHERMTDDEIADLFHTTRDKIPDYDVVPVRHNRYKRSNQNLRMQFTAFGKRIEAYLHPSDGQLMGINTPVWLASTKSNGTIEYKKMRKGIVGIVVSSFFTSNTDFSTVTVNQMKGKNPSFDGIVKGLVIRSLPKRFQEEIISKNSSETPNASRTMLDTHHHVIIKSTSVTEEEKIRRLERQIREASRSGIKTNASQVNRAESKIIYPSLLIQTDFKGSKTTQDDLAYYEEIIYQLAFWNAVDLRFRHLNEPKIRIRIAGIIIGQDRSATPFLKNHRSNDVVDIGQAWDETLKYWYNMNQHEDFPHEAYNIVVTMTDSEMIENGNQLLGYADITTCTPPGLNKFYAAAIVRDNGGFDGILPATHELGHVLGLYHDPESGDECGSSNGFIMARRSEARPRNLEWSPCSLKLFAFISSKNWFSCYDEPAEFHPPGDPVQRLLPGDVWGRHKQCQGRGYNWACDPSPDMCTQMQCYYTDMRGFLYGFGCQYAGPAAEGTLCAPGHKCVDGVCQCMTADCIYVNGTTGS